MERTLDVNTCIVGGGPAGMVLGLLLARAGVSVMVLEKHADFLRDFRGDIVHPCTLRVLKELGLLDAFLTLPHAQFSTLGGDIFGQAVKLADFSHLSIPYIVVIPQWDFLAFLAEQAKAYPQFQLLMSTQATGLIEDDGRVVGVRAQDTSGDLTIHAQLVIGADGRHSTVRTAARLIVVDYGVPIDVCWFRLSREPGSDEETLGRIVPGRMVVTINRGSYWQCGYIIPKGGIAALQAQGLLAFREAVVQAAPCLQQVMHEITDWEQVKLLTVKVDLLSHWFRPGLLCIGDAAHAMSPVGGVGINLAIQDAVATANILTKPLKEGTFTTADLAKVQARRNWPVHMTQRIQLALHKRVLSAVLAADAPMQLPWAVRLLNRWAWLRRIPAYLIGMGFRPERVKH